MRACWAALIHLPSAKEGRLSTILQSIGLAVCSGDWEHASQPRPDDPPLLAIVALEDYARKCSTPGWFQSAAPPPLTVLIGAGSRTPETLGLQLRHDVLNVIPEALYDDRPCLERVLRGFVFPDELFDIRRFAAEQSVIKRFTVTTLPEKHQVAEDAVALVQPYAAARRHLRDIRLIVNELINNAIFHSFLSPSGAAKYSARRFQTLEVGESVVVEVAVADEAVVVAVEDNCGTLSPHEVLKYMQRQTTGEGLYDSHGRGFYLMTNLTDHLSVCLEPGKRTRIVALNHAGASTPVGSLNFFIAG